MVVVKKNAVLSAAVLPSFIGSEQSPDLLLILGPGPGINTITYAGAFNGSLDQAGILQFFEMLGDRRLSQTQFFDQLAVNAVICLDQILNDGDSGPVSQGLHHGLQLVL